MERAVAQHTFPRCACARRPVIVSLPPAAGGAETDLLVWNDRRMQQERKGSGLAARIRRRVRRVVQTSPAPGAVPGTATSAGTTPSEPTTGADVVRPGSIEELRAIRAQIAQVETDLAAADQERESLKA